MLMPLSTLLFLVSMYWPWLAGAVAVGLVTGWLSFVPFGR